MEKGTTADNLKSIQAAMDALRSELLKFSEEQAQNDTKARSDPLHLPLMHSVMTIQEAMRTFISIATVRDK
ncbi:hypothetical protein LJC23_00015 [Desulfovibrio sp. OttesenSCG-928-I05]|nr:hypothetical protein [Desulfovibrio sp. OttesenSCG-928-O18]MDL2271400.1 hypothetical protein [Desulfovibrio sp. OttesenSCG-928-I05]